MTTGSLLISWTKSIIRSTLIEHFQAKLEIPGVLFYPGEIIPPAGLSFMGVHEAEHNYRAKIL